VTDETKESEWPPVHAIEAAKLYDWPTVTVEGRDGPVIVMTEAERDNLARTMMTLEHRVRSLGDHRRIQQMMEQNREGHAIGRIAVDLATDMVGIDEAAREIVGVLAYRLSDSDDARERANGAVLAEALKQIRRDPKSVH
jgi:hypothetical protein